MADTATESPAVGAPSPAGDAPEPALADPGPTVGKPVGCPMEGIAARAAPTDAGSKLDLDILDAMAKLFGQMIMLGEALAEQFGVPLFCVKALHILDESMPMKELGQRMRCDPSFVTAIADTLEKRGLARREPCPADRRVKNLVLNAEGLEVERQMEKEIVSRMPWSRALDLAERESFLALILKLIDAERTGMAGTDNAGPAADTSRPTSTEAAMRSEATASSPATPTGRGRGGGE